MFYKCEIKNPTTAVRVIYDGIANLGPIRIDKGGEVVTAVLAKHIIDRLRRRAAIDGEDSELQIRVVGKVTEVEAKSIATGPTFSNPMEATLHALGPPAAPPRFPTTPTEPVELMNLSKEELIARLLAAQTSQPPKPPPPPDPEPDPEPEEPEEPDLAVEAAPRPKPAPKPSRPKPKKKAAKRPARPSPAPAPAEEPPERPARRSARPAGPVALAG